MKVLRNKPDKIGGIYRFQPGTTDEQIIEHILRDFSIKLLGILKDYYDPKVGCSSLCTYEIFKKRWSLEDPGDVSSNGEEIYSEIPSDYCADFIRQLPGGERYSEETIRRSFSGGEFPIVKIWKGYHQGKDEIHVTYHICR